MVGLTDAARVGRGGDGDQPWHRSAPSPPSWHFVASKWLPRCGTLPLARGSQQSPRAVLQFRPDRAGIEGQNGGNWAGLRSGRESSRNPRRFPPEKDLPGCASLARTCPVRSARTGSCRRLHARPPSGSSTTVLCAALGVTRAVAGRGDDLPCSSKHTSHRRLRASPCTTSTAESSRLPAALRGVRVQAAPGASARSTTRWSRWAKSTSAFAIWAVS